MPFKDEEKRKAYDKLRDRREYEHRRYHTNEKRKRQVKAAAKASRARLVARTTPQERTKLMQHLPSRTPAARRNEHLKKRYGLTVEQWEAMFDAQGRCCAICKSITSGWKRGWHTDHDHETRQLRDILCHRCNHILGRLNEDPALFQAFIEYMNRHK
jgi:Recombination endonuclease VII